MPEQASKRFLKRHHVAVTLVGALIVFATYVINDVLKDSLRGLTDSVDSATQFFLVRSDINNISDMVSNTDLHLLSFAGNGSSAPHENTADNLLSADMLENIRERQESIGISLDALGRLASALSTNAETDTVLNQYEQRLETLDKRRHRLLSQILEKPVDAAKDFPSASAAETRQVDSLRQLESSNNRAAAQLDIPQLGRDTDQLFSEVNVVIKGELVHAARVKEQRERSYQHFKWISYAW